MKNKLALALAAALFALPTFAMAQDDSTSDDSATADQAAPAEEAPAADEAESPFSWNLSLTSDYVFRGVSQTDREPAVQGGLDYSFSNGFYVGMWGSNVDFNDSAGPDMELDTYVGWNHDLSDDWNLDLMLTRYNYFGERNYYGSVDYNEFVGKITYGGVYTFTTAYANDYANLNFSSWYYNLGAAWDLGNDWGLNAGIGHTQFGDNNGSYNDWNLGVSKTWKSLTTSLNYYDTNLSGPRASDSIVLSFEIDG